MPFQKTSFPDIIRIVLSGLAGGFFSEAFMGALFVSGPVQTILYNPSTQSQLYREITPTRDLPLSIVGIILLSIAHSWLYRIFFLAIPGRTWYTKGAFWGFTIWLLYWVFQEWFVYRTLLLEPLLLNAFELVILLCGSVIEGTVIAFFFRKAEYAAS